VLVVDETPIAATCEPLTARIYTFEAATGSSHQCGPE
jgi:hypothetical protein